MSDKPNINRMMEVLSAILSDQYGCKITLKATPKSAVAETVERKAG